MSAELPFDIEPYVPSYSRVRYIWRRLRAELNWLHQFINTWREP